MRSNVLVQFPGLIFLRCLHPNIYFLFVEKTRYSFISRDDSWWIASSPASALDNAVEFVVSIKAKPLFSNGFSEQNCVSVRMSDKIRSPKTKEVSG